MPFLLIFSYFALFIFLDGLFSRTFFGFFFSELPFLFFFAFFYAILGFSFLFYFLIVAFFFIFLRTTFCCCFRGIRLFFWWTFRSFFFFFYGRQFFHPFYRESESYFFALFSYGWRTHFVIFKAQLIRVDGDIKLKLFQTRMMYQNSGGIISNFYNSRDSIIFYNILCTLFPLS